MIPIGVTIDNILSATNLKPSPENMARIYRLLNTAYFGICAKTSWHLLRKQPIELDMDGTDEDGAWLPSNLLGVDMVRDEDNQIDFVRRNASDVEPDEDVYRYYTFIGSSAPLFSGVDAMVSRDDAAFTSGDLGDAIAGGTPSTVDGEFVRFSGKFGYYEVGSDSSPYDISPAFKEESEGEIAFSIRPTETQKIIIVDPGEQVLDDRTIKMWYWAYPEPLSAASDVPILPSAQLLELHVLREMPEAKLRRPVSQGELDEVMAEAMNQNPDFRRKTRPRDNSNRIFDTTRMATDIFARRK